MTKCNECMFMCKEKTNEERIKCKDFITPKDNEELENQNKELIQKISELEAQNEKMKCCGNCKHCYLWEDFYINMNCSLPNTDINLGNKCDKWELAE